MPDPLQHDAAATPAWLDRVDPRARIVAAVLLAVVVALADDFAALAFALVVAFAAVACSGLSWPTLLRRLLPLNLVMLMLVALLPLTTEGAAVFHVGPLAFSDRGFALAVAIAAKGNAVVVLLAALLGTIDATTLGHALAHLHVPQKLTHLMLFTVRYLDVLHREFGRLSAAMKVRGFRPGMNRHTYRTYGYLVGMLLVRSFDRSERIVAAMKCRGFCGRFYLLDHFAFSRRDLPFCAVSCAVFLILVLVQCR